MNVKAWHIVGYTFAADTCLPEDIEEWAKANLRAEGILPHEIERAAQAGPQWDAGIRAHRSEGLLWLLAEIRGIDYGDERSYDSGDFPKVIFASDEDHESED